MLIKNHSTLNHSTLIIIIVLQNNRSKKKNRPDMNHSTLKNNGPAIKSSCKKNNRLDSASPKTLKDFFKIKSKNPSAKIIAGGTDLIVQLYGKFNYPFLIDISKLEQLKGISKKSNFIKIGALTTHTEIENNIILKKYANVLTQAAKIIGSPQIRNRGTIGGNIANASPAGDTLPPLYVLNAEIELTSESNTRIIPIAEFFIGPGKSIIKNNEIISNINIPIDENLGKGVFLRLGQREALAISKVSIALTINSKTNEFRIALGSVAPTVVRAPKTEKLLSENSLNEKNINEAVKTISKEVSPITDIRSDADYRKEMCGVLLKKCSQLLT